MPSREAFPFIVGCGRSGTTLLRAMLDSHPQLAIPAESHFIVPMALGRDRYERRSGFDAEVFISDLVAHEGFAGWDLFADEARDALAASPPSGLADAIRAVYRAAAARAGKPRFGDKTPSYVLHLSLLAALFPEARFLHVVRDGRDVALSMLDVEWGPSGLEPAALIWKGSVEAARRAGSALGPQRYREVRYERLVSEPEAVLRELCSFVELGFDERMLRYQQRAPAIVAAYRLKHEHRHLSRPPTPGLRQWRRELSRSDARLFAAVAGDTLEALGYPTA